MNGSNHNLQKGYYNLFNNILSSSGTRLRMSPFLGDAQGGGKWALFFTVRFAVENVSVLRAIKQAAQAIFVVFFFFFVPGCLFPPFFFSNRF